MFKTFSKFVSPVIQAYDKTDKRVVRRLAFVDQYDGQEFNINEAGYPRNDISSLARAQSKSEFDAILSRLTVTSDSKSLPKDLSDKDALKLLRSKYTQSPNELMLYAEQVAAYDVDKINAAYAEALKDKHFDEVDEKSDSNTAE